MGQKEVPKQVRVRTDEGNEYRYDAIMQAAERFDCNKTRAIVLSCDAAGQLVDNVQEALNHEDLPPSLAKDLAETISTRHIKIEPQHDSLEFTASIE